MSPCIKLTYPELKPVLCVVLFLMASAPLVLKGQQIQKISVKSNDGKTGTAQYAYKKGKSDKTILHGNYTLDLYTSDSTDNNIVFIKDKWSGNYVDGMREGPWTFIEYEHDFKITDIENFEIKSSLLSKVRQLTGTYKNGYPTGPWTYENVLFNQGEKKALLSEASMNFADAKISGPFHFSTPGESPWLTVDGTVGANGLMENAWTFKYTTPDSVVIEEYRNYKNGFLLSIVKKIAGTPDTIQTLAFDIVNKRLASPETRGVKTIAKNFGLTFDIGYGNSAPELAAQQTVNERLEILLEKLADMDTALSHRDHLKIGTAKFEFEISEEQKINIRSIQNSLDSLIAMTETVMNYPILQINNQHTDSLAAAWQFFSDYARKLPGMQKLTAHLASEKFKYTDPDIYIRRFQNYVPTERSTTYVYNGVEKTKTITYHTEEVYNISTLSTRLTEELATMNQIYGYVQKEIHNIVQSEKLSDLESEIAEERNRLDSLFTAIRPQSDHARNMINYLHNTFAEHVFLDLQQAYASSENFSDKSDLAIEMLTVLRVLKSLPPQIIEIFEQQDIIREAYTETKFDPYTFNQDFKVIRKRRLYDKAAIDLFNHMLNTLRTETDHKQLGRHIREIRKLQARLLELLEEDTRRLESKIRQKKNPEEIKKMLNL